MEKQEEVKLDRQVVSGVSWKLAERILAQGISFIVTIILARILTPNDYGLVAMVNIFVSIADIVISSGFTAALIQKKTVSNKDYTTIFYVNLMISVGLYLLLFFLAPAISNMYKMESLTWILRVIALKLPLSAFYAVQSAYVSKNMQFKLFFFSTLFGTVISAIVGIVMAKQGYGVWALVAQQLVCLAINTLVMAVTIKWRPGKTFSKQTIKETYNFGTKIMATDIIGVTFNQLNAFIIGLFYSSEDLAYYSKGQNLPNMVTTITSTSFTSVLFPAIANIADDRKKVKKLLSNTTKILSFILFPILCGMLIVSNEIIAILYTSKWNGMIIFLQIMCIASMVSIIGEFDLIAMKAIGRGGLMLKLEFIKKPLFLAITFIALQFGVVWIAISFIVVNLLALIINSIALKKEINYGFFKKVFDCSNAILLSLVMMFAVYLVGLLPIESMMLNLIVKVAVGILVYFGLAFLTRNKELKSVVSFIKTKIDKKRGKEVKKEMKRLFVCNTIYQIIGASSIAASKNEKCDIIISDHSKNVDKIVKKLQKEDKYFANCTFVETKEFCFGEGDKTELAKNLLKVLKENHYLEKYDEVYFANWEPFTYMLYKKLKKINRDVKLCWFEDGFGTYSFEGQYFAKPSFKAQIKNLLTGRLSLYNEVQSINLFKPELLSWEIDKDLEINRIETPNEECKAFLNEIFDYKKLKDKYDKKFIFFEDGYKDFSDTTDVEVLEVIAKEIGRENIFVKRHPRDTTNKYQERGFETNEDTAIPSELIILNNDFSDTIFATFYSQAIVTAANLFGKKIKSIILCKLDKENDKNDPYFEFLNEKIYKNEPDIYIVPETKEELIKALKKDKKGKTK